MPSFTKHGQNRRNIYASCGEIIFFKKKVLIKKNDIYLFKNVCISKCTYSATLCFACQLVLEDHEYGTFKRILPTMSTYYEEMRIFKSTRINCDIYKTGSQNQEQGTYKKIKSKN